MTPIEQIDAVLKLLAEDETLQPYASDGEILAALIVKYPESEHLGYGMDTLRILNKLVKDGYVDFKEDNFKSGHILIERPNKYFITFDCGLFHQQGGYAEQLRNQNSHDARMESLEDSAKANRQWMLWLTVLVALGTTVAASYYLLEILNHWYFVYPRH